MKSSPAPSKLLWLVLLAMVFAFTSETASWWWDSRTPGATSQQGLSWLKLVAGLFALGGAALLWLALLRAKQATRQVSQLLASSLDTLDVALEIWDERDRLVLYNKKINAIYPNFHTPADIGKSFEALIRAKLKRQVIPAAI
ncbi:MAG: hypothetical protein ACYC4S_14070, partial [Rhodoferax sp.]